MRDRRPVLGLSAMAFAVAFNAPYAVLAATYEYPDILRRPAPEALSAFAQGGDALILTWHAFALCALAFAPLAIALSVTKDRLARAPGLTIAAATLGALAGMVQAMGLWRWVFVVPALARMHADPSASLEARAAAEHTFAVLNLYGGVAIGEHLGQWLTVLCVASLSCLQWREQARLVGGVGFSAALTIGVGTTEGVAIALGQTGDVFALFSIAGFLLLSVWLLATGAVMLQRKAKAQRVFNDI